MSVRLNEFVHFVQSTSLLLQVFRLQAEDGAAMYTTWQGDISAPTNNTEVVEISGLYAAKQGIMDGSEIVVTRVDNIPVCERLFVEPLSVDDWEILELHAAYLEQHLLDQVRVAWKGQIMPLWVNTKICIFVLIESVEPARDCCLLEQMTELHISPKDRHRTVVLPQQPDTAKPKSTKDSSWSQQRPPSKHRTAKLGHTSAQSAEKPCKANSIPIPDVNEDMFHRLLGYFHSLLFGVKPTADTGDDASPDELPYMYSYQREILPIDAVATSSFRIQPCIELDAFATTNDDAVIVKDVPSIVEIPPVLIGHQPTCVYLKMMSYCDTLRHRGYNINVATMPRTFLASIRTSRAPGEREEAMTKNMLNRKPQGIDPSKPSADSLPDEPEAGVHNIVRVVLLDSDNTYTHIGPSGLAIAQVKLGSSKGPLPGHMVVGDLLRRQMSLQVTGRLCVRPLVEDRGTTVAPAGVTGITLHPLFSLPAGFTQEMIVLAFKAWIREITCLDCPLVLSKGTLVKFFLKQDLYGEFLVLLDQTTPLVSPDQTLYCLLQSGLCEDLTIKVAQRMTPANKPPTIHLPCWELAHIDPKLPTVSRQQLGGVNKVFDELKTYLQVSLAVSPLNAHLMSQHRGQRLGTVLLTGPKGSGKSTLARAVCRMLGELPTLAHLTTIDCKPLRGKRVDAIQKQLNKVFSEAAWRQPAVILLDDLDHVTAAPTGPEQEMSGEAVYFARIAEVVKDLCYREVMENSTVVVMATCRSQDSLHPSLTSSRGHHFCQKVVHINPPDKDQRQEMLEALLTFKSEVKKDSVHNLDLAMVARQTEGHVVRDLEQVVDRAVHAHRMVTHDRVGRLGELTDADMEAALGGFTPMGLRHVALHNNGDITWDDVGGLHDVRRSLIETLQWPSKYPQLFANCPLRLRAGLLLYGAPGTGKTLLAAAVAKECGLNFISIKGPELLNKYIGASEQAVRDTFERAQSAKPCVLFFDEFDSLAPRRGHDSTGVTDRVVNQLLTQLDGVEGLEGVYVLAATSRPDLIDPALLRPGRLDKALHCTLPTEQDRVEILTALCRQIELGDDVDVHQVAAACDHFTGADLKALLYNAQLAAIHETTDLWGHVLGETVPTSKTTSEMHSSEGKTQAFPRRNTTFEYVVPENGHQHVKRERVNSSGDSSGSDVSSGGSGQSASWEVVPEGAINERMRTAVAEKPRKNGVVMGGRQMEKPVALGAGEPAALEERTVSQRVEGRRLVAYLPRLEEGIVSVTQRQEDELLSQYRGTAEKTVDKTRGKSVVSCITQSHLVEAACNMQPSVSESERNRFTQIYEQFVEGKGGGSLTEAGKRATLA